jgi:Na+-driven multidrug efflux pump
MKKKNYFGLFLLFCLAASGLFVKGFWGGCISGAFASLLVMATIGKWQLRKAIKKTDAYYSSQKQSNGN